MILLIYALNSVHFAFSLSSHKFGYEKISISEHTGLPSSSIRVKTQLPFPSSITPLSVQCVRAAIRNKSSYYYAKYCKIAARRGGKRALIAVAHSMLLAIYHILKHKQHFVDLGSDYFNTINADRILKRNLRSLHDLGYEVELSPTQAV